MRELLIMLNNSEIGANAVKKDGGKTTILISTSNEELAARLKSKYIADVPSINWITDN